MKYAYPLIASSLVLLQTSLYAGNTTDATQDASATKATASPAVTDQREQRCLKLFDKNGDGKLDDQERAAAKAHREKMLKQFDTNGDGKLDPTERKIRKQSLLAKNADNPSTNNLAPSCSSASTNQVKVATNTIETVQKPQAQNVTPATKKNTKHLAQKDNAAKQNVMTKTDGKKKQDAATKQDSKKNDSVQKVAKGPSPAILKDFDTNGDGVLSQDERAVLRQTRKTFDKDGNGKLSRTERQAMLASVSK